MAAHTQAKEYLLSYQNIIIFTVLFRAGDICLPLRHTGKCIFCLVIAVIHRDFVFYIMADSRVPQFTGTRRIFFGNVLLDGLWWIAAGLCLLVGVSFSLDGDRHFPPYFW